LLAGCQAARETSLPEPVAAADLSYAFAELQAAVEEGEDEIARAILRRLIPRAEDPLSAEMAASYSNVLAGRYVRDSVKAEVEVFEQDVGGFSVSLELSQDLYDEVRLRPSHLFVQATVQSIDLSGHQFTRSYERIVDAGDGYLVPKGETISELMVVDSPVFTEGFLAVRCRWQVSLGAGSVEVASDSYPLMGLPVKEGLVVRLSRELPTQAVEPSELYRYSTELKVRTEGLLERSVRISPSKYAETLDLFAREEPSLSPARMEELIPVLSWLTGGSAMQATGADWRKWLQMRALEQDRSKSLDLPDASM
jgi:hypothetical protein